VTTRPACRSAAAVLLAWPLLFATPAVAFIEGGSTEPAGSPEPSESGWLVAGSRPQDYRVELEEEGGRQGTLAASLGSRGQDSPPEGFVTLMRWIDARPYQGKRVRLSAWVKAESIEGWAGLWMRVDDDDADRSIAFDNMEDRAVRGTRDWRRYEVVVDVAPEGDRVSYGILLSGKGTAWVDDFQLEVVDRDVPATDQIGPVGRPRNLDFDHPPEAPP